MIIFIIVLIFLLIPAITAVLSASFFMYRYVAVRKVPIATSWDDDALFNKFRKAYESGPPVFLDKRDKLRVLGQNGEVLTVTSHDGLSLSGRLILPKDEPKCAVIMFHGYRSEPTHDFGPLAYDLINMGAAVVIVDQRAHGGSEGVYITFGVNERLDAVAWSEYIASRFPRLKLLLFGLSMGATTVLCASELKLPSNVAGIVADCGFTTPLAICKKVLTCDIKLPSFPLLHLSRVILRHRAGYDLLDISSVDSIRKTALPCLIIHGENDKFVPYRMGEEIRDAGGAKCTFVSVPKAGHGEAYLYSPENYLESFRTFADSLGIEL